MDNNKQTKILTSPVPQLQQASKDFGVYSPISISQTNGDDSYEGTLSYNSVHKTNDFSIEKTNTGD
jgi:hypothetical protein